MDVDENLLLKYKNKEIELSRDDYVLLFIVNTLKKRYSFTDEVLKNFLTKDIDEINNLYNKHERLKLTPREYEKLKKYIEKYLK